MAQEIKYAYDKDSVKAIVHWALTAHFPINRVKRIGEYIRRKEIHTGEYTRYKPKHDPFYNLLIDRSKEFIEGQE